MLPTAPKLPWWVKWWTHRDTTRANLRGDAWFDFIVAAVALVCFALLAVYWNMPSLWRAMFLPFAFILAGFWKLAASRWIDRHEAWSALTAAANEPTATTPTPTRRLGRTAVALLVLALLLAASGWRYWYCFAALDEDLPSWGDSAAFLKEEVRLIQDHNASMKALRAQNAPPHDRELELQRYETASAELAQRKAEATKADAPRRRWFEFAVGSLFLLLALVLCWGAYKGWAEAKVGRI